MKPHMIAALVDGGIPLIAGICGTFIAYQPMNKWPPDPQNPQNRLRPMLKIGSPLLILFGCVQIIRAFV